MPAATSALSAQRGRPPKLRRDSWALAEVTPSRAAIRRAFTSISVIRAPAGPRLGRPAQSGKPARDTAMVRARAPACAAEAVRAVPAVRGGAGWGAVVGCAHRRWHPLALGIDIALALRRVARRRRATEVFLERVAGQARGGDAAPPRRAAVEADGRARGDAAERAGAGGRFLSDGERRGGVGERVADRGRVLGAGGRRAKGDENGEQTEETHHNSSRDRRHDQEQSSFRNSVDPAA